MTKNADITIFNKRIDAGERREVFIPTVISGVCWYDVRSMKQSERRRTGEEDFVIRIPYDAEFQENRTYISESEYRNITDEEAKNHWTIQLDSFFAKGKYVYDGIISMQDISEIRNTNGEFATVIEYADNTVRGTERTKHWRIGGA